MAGDWIKMRIELQSHPKIVRILSATQSDKFRAIGGLHAVWSVFDLHSENGKLHGYTPALMDHIIGWDGFSQAMVDVGWLLFDGGETLSMPEFTEHNGKSAKRRAEDQKRKRDERKCPQSVRNMSANEADEKRTREENRREEGKTNSVDKKPSSISLQSFLDSLNGARAIDSDDPIFAYCEKCGISEEMLNLCWLKFKDYYLENPSKKYKDWRKTFRNCVKDNWYGIWWFNADNKAELSNKGRQAAVSFKEAA